jgi:hypothetical protein
VCRPACGDFCAAERRRQNVDEIFPGAPGNGSSVPPLNGDFEELHERFLLSTKVNECGVDGVEIRTLNAPETTRTIGGNETYENGAE